MPLPSLRKRPKSQSEPNNHQVEYSPHQRPPNAAVERQEEDATPLGAVVDNVPDEHPQGHSKAAAVRIAGNPPSHSKDRAAHRSAHDNDEEHTPQRSRGAWLKAVLGRLTQLPMTLQVVMVAVPILAITWPWVFRPVSQRAPHDAFTHMDDDFGPDGYPRLPVAQADRKVTEQDAALMLQHAGGQSREATQALQQTEHGKSQRVRAAKVAVLHPTASASKPRRSVRFYGPGGTLVGPQEKISDTAVLLVGTRIEVVLDVGISTSHRGSVMGRVLKDVVSPQGHVVLTVGTFLKGRASGDFEAGRMFVDFDQAVVSGKTLRLQGYAIAHNEPGIAASKREITSQERQKASLADGVLETAKDVAGRVGDGVASALTRNVAHRSISQIQKDVTTQPSYVLSLPAGVRFEVIVTG